MRAGCDYPDGSPDPVFVLALCLVQIIVRNFNQSPEFPLRMRNSHTESDTARRPHTILFTVAEFPEFGQLGPKPLRISFYGQNQKLVSAIAIAAVCHFAETLL